MASNVDFDDDVQKADAPRRQLQDEMTMGRMLDKDAERRKATTHIYDSVLKMVELEGFRNFSSEINKEYIDYIKTMRSNRGQLQKKKCPIIVAGDTSAGKSSLVNLLIEEDLLPHGVLRSSTTITQIFNSEEKEVRVLKEDGKTIVVKNITKERLKQFISEKKSDQNTRLYKRVDIFWPVPMLKDYACIVDTPGIGEFGKMSTSLQDYLPEAVAFIYVIDVSNSGGVHEDRIGKLFAKQRELEKKGSLNQFDHECAIFVCNKWDQVSEDEDDEVWREIAKNIRSHWPTGRNVDITERMFKMSVEEVRKGEIKGIKRTNRFSCLISGIDRLINACLERRVKKHLHWLQMFLHRILTIVIAKKNASRKDREINENMKMEVEKRLKTLENNTENIKSKMKTEAEVLCRKNAVELTEYLTKEKTIQEMFQWHEDELPDFDDLDIIRRKSIEKITDRVNDQILEWCEGYNITEQWTLLFDQFREECKLLEDNISEIDDIIQGRNPLENDEKFKGFASDIDFPKLKLELSSIETFFLLVTSPVWFPVLAIGQFVFSLADVIEKKVQIKLYNENKTVYMNTLATEIMKKCDEEAIYNSLRMKFLQDFLSRKNQVCDVVIPNQIKADRELIDNIVKEERDAETLIQEYTPIELQCKAIIGKLLYVKIKYFSENIPCILEEQALLGKGSFAEVHQCKVDFGVTRKECAVKRLSPKRLSDHYLQLSEAENMMKLQHTNIVRCLGISISQKENKEYIDIFMEKCDCSLDNVFLCDNHPNEMCKCPHRRKTCHWFEEKDRKGSEYMGALTFFTKMLKDILIGLAYLHTKEFAHRDLKLSNILIEGGTAKIADIGMLKPQNLLQGTIIGTPSFMAPEVLEGRIYDLSADIFSLAITMWEMWYGRRVYSDCDVHSEKVIMGMRPKLNAKWAPPEMVTKMIENSWKKEPNKRPTASELITTLEEIEATLIN